MPGSLNTFLRNLTAARAVRSQNLNEIGMSFWPPQQGNAHAPAGAFLALAVRPSQFFWEGFFMTMLPVSTFSPVN